MAEIQITGAADDLETEDELFAVLKELKAQGWRGSIRTYPVSEDPEVPWKWEVEVHIDDDSFVNGSRPMRAELGDKKVTTGSTITLMTQDAFTAAYGA